MGAQLLGISAEGQHSSDAGQTPGATATFHAVDDKLIDIPFDGS
jgi:hypothetical protein